MVCHRRCTFAITFIFSLLMVLLMAVELFTPLMWLAPKEKTATGLLVQCKNTETLGQYLEKIGGCFDFKFFDDKVTYLSIVVLGVVIIWFIGSLVILCKLCRASSRFPKFFKKFVIFGIVLNLLSAALVGVTAYFLKTYNTDVKQIEFKFSTKEFMPLSFYALLAVGGLHLITFIMLICIVCCKGKDDGENEPEEEEVLPDAYGEVNMYGEEAYPTEPNPGVANGWVKTFPSNIEFADGKMGREGDLYRGFYGYVQSAVFGSA